MNKKGILAVIVIIVVVVIGYKVWGGGSSTINNSVSESPAVNVPAGVTKDSFAPVTKDTVDTSLIGRLKVASVAAAETGTRVALVNGKAQFNAEGVKGTITLGDVAVAKILGTANYVIASLAVTNGSSAASQYIVLFQDVNGNLTDNSYALVGTGAKITGIRADEIAGGLVISVSFTDANGKAHTKILVVENGAFNGAKEINL